MKVLCAVTAALISLGIFSPAAQAETCPSYNFSQIFYEDYYPGKLWTTTGQKKTITWSASATTINDELVNRKFTNQEIDWLKSAFKSWDDVVDSISFTYTEASSAEIVVGYVALTSAVNQPGATGYWNAWWVNDIRNRATIKLKSSSTFLNSQNGFIHAVQHELGNVLGLGDIRTNAEIQSVQEDPWDVPYGQIPLSDYDAGMIRQLYGESTCQSSWKSSALQKAENDLKLALANQVKAEADLKLAIANQAKAEADLKLALNNLDMADKKLLAAVSSQNTLELELDKLKSQFTATTSELEALKALLATANQERSFLKSKLSKICKNKPKPKGC